MSICIHLGYIFKAADRKNIMEESKEPKYVSMRVPKAEYDKLRRVREELQQNPDYSWVGSLALGAFVGLVAGLAIRRLTESDDGSE